MAADDLTSFLQQERNQAENTLMNLVPEKPYYIVYQDLWPQVLGRHVVRRPDVNEIAARLRREGRLLFPDWEKGKRISQPNYRIQRGQGTMNA